MFIHHINLWYHYNMININFNNRLEKQNCFTKIVLEFCIKTA